MPLNALLMSNPELEDILKSVSISARDNDDERHIGGWNTLLIGAFSLPYTESDALSFEHAVVCPS